MGFHIHIGHIIKKAATIIVDGTIGFVTGGPGAAASVAVSYLAKDGAIQSLQHLIH